MDFTTLLPNFVYLALVMGFLLIFLAIVTPGTGLVELFALFTLLFAGYGMYVLAKQINFLAVAVLIVGVIPFMLAMRKSGRRVFLVIALVALTLGSAYLFTGDPWWIPGVNLPMVILVTFFTVLFIWIVVLKSMEAALERPAQDLSRLIGMVGEATTSINEQGTVQVASELWSARSHEVIATGQAVRVIGRDGFVLEVEPVHSSAQPAA